MILPVFSAFLGILAFLPFSYFWILGFVFLAPLFIFFLKEEKFWRLVAGTLIFRFIFALGTVYYTFEPITWFFSFSIFLGLAITIFIMKKLSGAGRLIFILPFAWTLFDYLQARYSFLPAFIMTSGNIFGSSPFLGLAAVGGLTLLIFFTAIINVLIVALILKISLNKKILILNSAFLIILIIAAWRFSNYQLKKISADYGNLKNSLKIAVVSVSEKFERTQFEQIKNELAAQRVDLLIFPEDIFNDDSGNFSPANFQHLAKNLNNDLLATFDTIQNNKKYNSTLLLNKNGEVVDIYNKNQLTFIGEYWPFGRWRPFFFDWLKKNKPQYENYVVFNPQNAYSSGEKKILMLDGKIPFAALICLEIHYPGILAKYKKMGVRFFVNPTSNRWLDMGIKHFLYLTNNLRKIEAVWLKTPIIASGVRDYAGIIAPDGKTDLIDYNDQNKNFAVFFGEIKY
ncbi:MAG: hypothetical protein UU85_C0001G0129 [Candidatus Wolfebacteria bacterium GW2011_GWA2_42_10]|uniref:CN hydrolase domain-containing protein n=2 Tax=Candidatus Wolfeibacteriota TaxID=1752735 RepID=A0A0G0XLE5_9BACT|nr:MAG: hypothetical protein UU38_C0003G0189 [Candidatus Wolfebacteria bacterium GW2011_GWB1_41_12]KKS25699.1 MAG: hypothetical protein UU85_C0001G0129 [Candidatus Wolfebacteria bacterium GW2011_GWA2_42_10]KKT56369.1 MAG: hypothetical protein UW50_C0002G0046 [Candidatus Wolfebacteria bacterium GW2011_GWA1_44_24]